MELNEPSRRHWPLWKIDPDTLVLYTTAGGYRYEIDLEEISTAAQVLDWIFQIDGKAWAGSALVAQLVRAFRDLGGQGVMCPWGQSPKFDLAARARELANV